MNKQIEIAIIGFGKVAREQHLPAIRRSQQFVPVFAVDLAAGQFQGLPVFPSIEAALAVGIGFDAAAICTPPQVRIDACRRLIQAGSALLLEKPPATSVSEAEIIARLSGEAQCPIFTAWHSRFASQMGAARRWVRAHQLVSGTIEWRENPAKWHPGQDWLWKSGGFGVFDPGINALSILTGLYPGEWKVSRSDVRYLEHLSAPAAAEFTLVNADIEIEAAFEFHARDEEVWTIQMTASNGDTLLLSEGGAAISENGGPVRRAPAAEYDAVYACFADLVREGRSHIDLSPLRIVEDITSFGRRDDDPSSNHHSAKR